MYDLRKISSRSFSNSTHALFHESGLFVDQNDDSYGSNAKCLTAAIVPKSCVEIFLIYPRAMV